MSKPNRNPCISAKIKKKLKATGKPIFTTIGNLLNRFSVIEQTTHAINKMMLAKKVRDSGEI